MTFPDQLLAAYPGVVRREARNVRLEQAAYQRSLKGRRRPLSQMPFERIKP